MLAPEGFLAAAFAFPHLQADLEGFLEALEALLDRGKGDAEAATLGFVPGGTNPEPRAPGREDVEGGDRLGEDARLVVNDARHHGASPGSLGHRRHAAELP